MRPRIRPSSAVPVLVLVVCALTLAADLIPADSFKIAMKKSRVM